MYSITFLFMALWWCNPPPSGRTVISERGVKLFSREVWVMYSRLGYQSRASHFPCFTHCFHPPPAKHSSICIEQSSFRGRMCHSSTPQAFHLHPLFPCGPPGSKWLPPTLGWLLSAAGKQKAWVHSTSADFQRHSPASRLSSLAMTWNGELLWEVERSSQIHQGQQSVGNREEGPDCKRGEFNVKPRSVCTWPSALL